MVSDTLLLFNLLSSLYHPAQLQEVEEEEVLQGSQDCELDGACESSHSEGGKTTTGLLDDQNDHEGPLPTAAVSTSGEAMASVPLASTVNQANQIDPEEEEGQDQIHLRGSSISSFEELEVCSALHAASKYSIAEVINLHLDSQSMSHQWILVAVAFFTELGLDVSVGKRKPPKLEDDVSEGTAADKHECPGTEPAPPPQD
ncbi:Neuroblastoma Breakpoint Family Member 6 [Manis pentadactyla]|nr:Neuroblastoma Breakpoint Family Member 6 [Manis pentadactyla]